MADKLGEQIAERTKTYKNEGCWIDKEALEQVFICPNTDCLECFIQHGVVNLFKSQGYLSPEEHRKKVERVSKEITTDLLENHKAKMTESKKQFKSQVEGLTVIGDDELSVYKLYGTEGFAGYDVGGLLKAQLLADRDKLLGGME